MNGHVKERAERGLQVVTEFAGGDLNTPLDKSISDGDALVKPWTRSMSPALMTPRHL